MAAIGWEKNKHSKTKGQAGEVLFRFACMSQGYVPHTPDGDPPCHDLVVMNPANGRCKVTQVKAIGYRSLCRADRKDYSYKVMAKCKNRKVHLRDSIVDILAAYVIDEKAWYLVPVQQITGTNMSLRPHIAGRKGKYEKYRERWSVFGRGVTPLDI